MTRRRRGLRRGDALDAGPLRVGLHVSPHVYDLRGITDTLDADDGHVGLIRFKAGTGGEAVEYAGEWDLPVNRAIYKAFQLYLARRG